MEISLHLVSLKKTHFLLLALAKKPLERFLPTRNFVFLSKNGPQNIFEHDISKIALSGFGHFGYTGTEFRMYGTKF